MLCTPALVGLAVVLGVPTASPADGWVHPAGQIDVATLAEVRRKRDTQQWAADALAQMDRGVQPWLQQTPDRLDALFPKHRTSVYWLLMCPECRSQLRFDPFDDTQATCPACRDTYPLSQPSTATEPDSPYAGTLYDGWACHHLMAISRAARDLALLHALGGDETYARRAAEILRMFRRHIAPLPVVGSAPYRVIWTYQMEGDCTVLAPLQTAYELLRGTDGLFTDEEHSSLQQGLFKHWTDAVFRVEQDSSTRHNNMYRYLMAVAQTGCILEDTDYVDWAFGRRAYSPEHRPKHCSLAWLTDHNYLPDGAFHGLCSAYHLYALGPHLEAMVLGMRLSQQMPDLFPPDLYDETDPANPRSRVLRRAVKWFTAQAFPDLTMAPFGDMGGRVGLADYPATAEIGYRLLNVEEAGGYRSIREGSRGLTGLLYGADTVEQEPWTYRSANLSSGFVALKRGTPDNRLYAGLNALLPGSMHSHGDRLNLITYSRDRMLTGEKETRYTDPEQRVYSGASYAHNTVTVDETSQVHGDELQGEAVPHIETFVDLPTLQLAEAWGDRVYPQTATYRRLICQFDEYLLDFFTVSGGSRHDWFFHGVGENPELGLALEPRESFEPAGYVTRGKRDYLWGRTDAGFRATWRIPAEPDSEWPGRGRDVLSQVLLNGAAGQEVCLLSTFPHPAEHSLLVRRGGPRSSFVALHEAYHGTPVAIEMQSLPGHEAAVRVMHADGAGRLLIRGSGKTDDGLELEGTLGTVTLDRGGKVWDITLVRGRRLAWRGLRLTSDREVSVSIRLRDGKLVAVSSPAVGYETVEGAPVYRLGADAEVALSLPDEMAADGKGCEGEIVCPGQTADGPVEVEIAR